VLPLSLPTATSAPAPREPWFATRPSAFLIWVAFCNFVTVAGATYLVWDQNALIRVASTLAALAVGVIAAFGIPVVTAWADARSAPEQRQPGPPPNRSHPQHAREPEKSARAAPPEQQPERRRIEQQLSAQLAAGTRLRSRLEQTSADGTSNPTEHIGPQIDSWIDETRAILAGGRHDFADYFANDTHETAETNWPPKLQDAITMSQAGRLNRHLDRLTELLSRGGGWS
jgi:hypothetical protein